MLSNNDLKDKLYKVHPEYFEYDKKGNLKWKTARVFSTILYPENIEDIDDSCRIFGVPCSLSPLHDKDIKDKDTGELKKAHYHLVAYFSGKSTPYKFYSALCSGFGDSAFSTIEIGNDLSALIKYQVHLGFDDKFQYNPQDIKDFNGFNSEKYLIQGVGDIMDNFRKIKEIIKKNNFIFYNDLDDYLDDNEPLLYSALLHDRVLARQCKDYMKAREYQMVYDGNIIRSKITEKLPDGRLNQIFNRQIVG